MTSDTAIEFPEDKQQRIGTNLVGSHSKAAKTTVLFHQKVVKKIVYYGADILQKYCDYLIRY